MSKKLELILIKSGQALSILIIATTLVATFVGIMLNVKYAIRFLLELNPFIAILMGAAFGFMIILCILLSCDLLITVSKEVISNIKKNKIL